LNGLNYVKFEEDTGQLLSLYSRNQIYNNGTRQPQATSNNMHKIIIASYASRAIFVTSKSYSLQKSFTSVYLYRVRKKVPLYFCL